MSFEAVRAGHEGRPGWEIRFDYNEEKIARLKRFTPRTARSWNEEQKTWWVAVEWEFAILAVFPQFEGYLNQLELEL